MEVESACRVTTVPRAAVKADYGADAMAVAEYQWPNNILVPVGITEAQHQVA
jgi:hypothetical protein